MECELERDSMVISILTSDAESLAFGTTNPLFMRN